MAWSTRSASTGNGFSSTCGSPRPRFRRTGSRTRSTTAGSWSSFARSRTERASTCSRRSRRRSRTRSSCGSRRRGSRFGSGSRMSACRSTGPRSPSSARDRRLRRLRLEPGRPRGRDTRCGRGARHQATFDAARDGAVGRRRPADVRERGGRARDGGAAARPARAASRGGAGARARAARALGAADARPRSAAVRRPGAGGARACRSASAPARTAVRPRAAGRAGAWSERPWKGAGSRPPREATIALMSHIDELDEFEAELELRLKREYGAVFSLFRYCVLTQDATYLCNKLDLQYVPQPAYPFFHLKMEDVWVWDKNRPTRMIPRTEVYTSSDVTVEELRGEGDEPALTAEDLAKLIGELPGSDDEL